MTIAAEGQTIPTREAGRVLGRSVGRKEDRPLLTGRSRFVDDLNLPGTAHAAILRSPHAHARIAALEVEAARSQPGVIDVVTGADLPEPRPRIPMRLYSHPGMERFLQSPLAGDTVRFSGEPVAVVVAETRYAAEDALELVGVEYEPLEPVLDPERTLDPAAPVLHPEAGTNLVSTIENGHGDPEAAFAEADLVIEERLSCQRHAAVPMEPRGLAAALDPESGRLTLWGAAKVVHINRRMLAGLLDWPEDRLRLIELDVGGGFGARGEFYPEDFLIPFCAIRARRPVTWTADRDEELRALNHSREQVHDVAVALSADGTLLAIRDRFLVDTGAYVRTHGAILPTLTSALLPGPYAWRAYECTARQVVSNKTPAGTYRAPGRYEANYVRERMIDIAARRLGRDPADLRRQNLVPPERMPYPVGTHTGGQEIVFDSGDYPALLEQGLEAFEYARMLRWRNEDPGPRRRRGIGVAFFVEKSGIARWEYARVEIREGGEVRVHVGSASVGQGVETVLAQICAESLGVRYEDVEVVHGDTDDVPEGVGSFGSRATSLGGAAVMRASQALRERLVGLAAEELEASPDDLVLEGDRVLVRGSPGAGLSLAALARKRRTESNGTEPLLEEEARFDSEQMSFPYGLQCVAVELDAETGAVEIQRYAIAYDVGVAINPKLVEGQVIGGAAQGIGGALLEEFAYDAGGQLVSASFMDYLLPTAGEVPQVDVLITEDAPTPLTPLGAKGAGEGGTAAAGAAIANAVSDAVGDEARSLPLTPEWVAARAGGQAPTP